MQKFKENLHQKKLEAERALYRNIYDEDDGDESDLSFDEEAISYIRNLIKRDSKPTNPEKVIKIRLFDRMVRNKKDKPACFYA